MRRQDSVNAVKVRTENAEYLATVERVKSDRNGNPRYRVALVILEDGEPRCFAPVYLTGGYEGEEEIARAVAREHEKEIGIRR